jgi:hypothetical protein
MSTLATTNLKHASSGSNNIVLDSSGRALVGVSSANANGGILQLSSGITFPATQVLSTDPNTLDDYEEGTWTPSIDGTTTSPSSVTYSTRVGYYRKIGSLVFISCAIQPGTVTGGSGNLRFTGLPFVSANLTDCIGTGVSSNNGDFNWGTSKTGIVFSVGTNSSNIGVWAQQNATTEAGVPLANFASSSKYLFFSLTYIAA